MAFKLLWPKKPKKGVLQVKLNCSYCVSTGVRHDRIKTNARRTFSSSRKKMWSHNICNMALLCDVEQSFISPVLKWEVVGVWWQQRTISSLFYNSISNSIIWCGLLIWKSSRMQGMFFFLLSFFCSALPLWQHQHYQHQCSGGPSGIKGRTERWAQP